MDRLLDTQGTYESDYLTQASSRSRYWCRRRLSPRRQSLSRRLLLYENGTSFKGAQRRGSGAGTGEIRTPCAPHTPSGVGRRHRAPPSVMRGSRASSLPPPRRAPKNARSNARQGRNARYGIPKTHGGACSTVRFVPCAGKTHGIRAFRTVRSITAGQVW